MNVFTRKFVRVAALTLAAAVTLGTTIFAADLDVVERDAPIVVSESITGTALGLGTVEGNGVNVRENPTADSAVVGVLNRGTQVVIISQEGEWYRISCEDVSGYMRADFLSLEDSGEADLGHAMVDSEAVNVRADADENADTVASLEEEDVVSITGIQDGWYQVEMEDGSTGYIRSDLINPTLDIPAEKLYSYAVVSCNGAKLRSEPDGAQKDVLMRNSRMTLIEQDGDWLKIQYNSYTGYVHASLVTLTNDSSKGSTSIATQNEEAEAARKRAEEQAKKPSNNGGGSGGGSGSSGGSGSGGGGYSTPSYDSGSSGDIVSTAKQYLGVPYVWGGTSPSGFDCSGFTQYVFRKCGYSINRVASSQYSNGSYVSYSDLQPGDLVFFANTYGSGITHVGIYIGGGDFIHAGGGCVKITSLSSSYYSSRYYGARRVA